jgi:hypothetical protein
LQLSAKAAAAGSGFYVTCTFYFKLLSLVQIVAVVAFVSKWLSLMITLRRRLPEVLLSSMYWDFQISILFLPSLEIKFIRQLYNMFAASRLD